MGARGEIFARSPRLVLGPIAQDDLPALARIGADPRVAAMMGTIPIPWPDAAMRRWVAKSRFRGEVGFRLAVIRPDTGMIGVVGLAGAPASLAYFLDPDHWGRGYATEAARAFVGACFARFRGLDVIAADHFADNPGSGRVLQKLGFRSTGQGVGKSLARLEPAPNIHYRLWRSTFEATP